MAAARKGGGGKLGRTKVLSIRLDPKLHFGAELAVCRERLQAGVKRGAVIVVLADHGRQNGQRRLEVLIDLSALAADAAIVHIPFSASRRPSRPVRS